MRPKESTAPGVGDVFRAGHYEVIDLKHVRGRGERVCVQLSDG